MEMRRRMIREVHLDRDPVAHADPRHRSIIAGKPDA